MELQNIKTKVDFLEDRVITNFEKYFSYLVLEDFYSGGFNDRIEDEFFYEEYFSKYENDIIDLLLLIEDEFSEECINFKIRLIKMKRKINTLLSKVKEENDNIVNPRRQRRNCEFLLNQNLAKDNFVEFLYTQLKDNKLINTSYEELKKHFDGDWDSQIQWYGTEPQISKLINSLIEQEILDTETQNFRHKLITTHFLNKNGKPFNAKQLSTVKREKIEIIPDDDIILKITDKISTHF